MYLIILIYTVYNQTLTTSNCLTIQTYRLDVLERGINTTFIFNNRASFNITQIFT